MPKFPFRPFDRTIGQSTLRVEYCDITTLNVDVMVSSDDIDLSMGGGVSQALLRAGGEPIWREVQSQAPVRVGEVAVTTAGRLSAKRIFHAAVLDYARRNLTTIDLIRKVTKRCLSLCDQMGFQSIAFPALATGVSGLSPERSAVAMLIETASHLSSPTSVRHVILALYARPDLPQGILPRFYSQVEDLLERSEEIKGITSSLEKLEHMYRKLNSSEAAELVLQTRETLRGHQQNWERELIERELGDSRQERSSKEYREDIDSEIMGISGLRRHREEWQRLISERSRPEDWRRLECEYTEYRSAAVREMILIRKRNITDIEKELALRGFSAELNRALDHQREELLRLQAELRELGG